LLDAIQLVADHLFFASGCVEPALIVIDTVARAMPGKNENSAQDMGELIASMDLLRELWGAAVVAVHHTGHVAESRARGSSSFYAALDSEYIVSRRGPGDLLLKNTKAKDWEPQSPVSLTPVVVDVQVPGTSLQATTLALSCVSGGVPVDDAMERVMQLRTKGHSIRAIAHLEGMSKSSVERLLAKGKGTAAAADQF
jgi:hypothetical protein